MERPEEVVARTEIKAFYELSLDELYQVMVLRNEVFVVGQKITAEAEVDGRDPECHHALMWRKDELVGTARLFMKERPVQVGRVAIASRWQGEGLGTALMEAIGQFLDGRRAELHAQAHLERWYQRLGWRRVGERFLEAQIEHVRMIWDGR